MLHMEVQFCRQTHACCQRADGWLHATHQSLQYPATPLASTCITSGSSVWLQTLTELPSETFPWVSPSAEHKQKIFPLLKPTFRIMWAQILPWLCYGADFHTLVWFLEHPNLAAKEHSRYTHITDCSAPWSDSFCWLFTCCDHAPRLPASISSTAAPTGHMHCTS